MLSKELPIDDNNLDQIPELQIEPEVVDQRAQAIDELRKTDPFMANAAELANNRRKTGVNLSQSRLKAIDKAQEFSLRLARNSAERSLKEAPPAPPESQ